MRYKKKVFTVRVVRPWNRLPKDVVDTPTLSVFKARLEKALRYLVCWEVSLHIGGCGVYVWD